MYCHQWLKHGVSKFSSHGQEKQHVTRLDQIPESRSISPNMLSYWTSHENTPWIDLAKLYSYLTKLSLLSWVNIGESLMTQISESDEHSIRSDNLIWFLHKQPWIFVYIGCPQLIDSVTTPHFLPLFALNPGNPTLFSWFDYIAFVDCCCS